MSEIVQFSYFNFNQISTPKKLFNISIPNKTNLLIKNSQKMSSTGKLSGSRDTSFISRRKETIDSFQVTMLKVFNRISD